MRIVQDDFISITGKAMYARYSIQCHGYRCQATGHTLPALHLTIVINERKKDEVALACGF